MENCHGKKSKQTTKMPCFLFILHICLIPFFSAHSGLQQKDPCIKYITVCCNLVEKCAYNPVHLCWMGRFSTWKLTTSFCSIKLYFSQKHKNHTYVAITCAIEQEFLFKKHALLSKSISYLWQLAHFINTKMTTFWQNVKLASPYLRISLMSPCEP